MARYEAPPFGRGETFGTASTSDGIQYEGKEWLFEDVDPTNKQSRTNQYVRVRVVRNTSAGALLPGRLANLAVAPNANGAFGSQVDGYLTTLAARGYPIDEFLPAAGVVANDLFYIVVAGPAKIKTDLATLTAINIGDVVVGQTAATSGATTAGRVIKQDLTGATALLGNQVQNAVGHAMSAATANNTDTSILVDVGKW